MTSRISDFLRMPVMGGIVEAGRVISAISSGGKVVFFPLVMSAMMTCFLFSL